MQGSWVCRFLSVIAGVIGGIFGIAIPCKRARADTISAIGGLSFGRNSEMNGLKSPPPLLGAEYMLGLGSRIDFGAFVSENFLSYTTGESGATRFWGLQGRLHLLASKRGPFVDAQVGLADRTQGANNSPLRMSYGAGAGYEMPISRILSLSPRAEVRYLPDSATSPGNKPVADAALMLSVHF